MKGFLFFDIDGTLIDSDHGKDITPEVLSALHQASQNGWGCFICSGRSLAGLQKYRNIGMDGYVFSDGAGILFEREKEEILPIMPDDLKDLMAQVMHTYDGEMFMSGVWKSFASKAQDDMIRTYGLFASEEGENPEDVIRRFGLMRLEEYDGTPILEADVVFDDDKVEQEFIRHLSPHLEYISTSASYGRNGNACGEVTRKGITKGYGIKRIVAHYGGDMKNTYAFGDSMNDASALMAANTGICMGNGAEELKEIADYITDDISEDGLIRAMHHFGII